MNSSEEWKSIKDYNIIGFDNLNAGKLVFIDTHWYYNALYPKEFIECRINKFCLRIEILLFF